MPFRRIRDGRKCACRGDGEPPVTVASPLRASSKQQFLYGNCNLIVNRGEFRKNVRVKLGQWGPYFGMTKLLTWYCFLNLSSSHPERFSWLTSHHWRLWGCVRPRSVSRLTERGPLLGSFELNPALSLSASFCHLRAHAPFVLSTAMIGGGREGADGKKEGLQGDSSNKTPSITHTLLD